MEGVDMTTVYKDVYVLCRKSGTLVCRGCLIEDRTHSFDVKPITELATDALTIEKLGNFSKYSHTFVCAKSVETELRYRWLRERLKLLAQTVYSRAGVIPPELFDAVETQLEALETCLKQGIDQTRSLLTITYGYPNGNTDEERKAVLREKLFQELKNKEY